MKICVAGLGIIGGSICLALKRAGYFVFGWNRSEKASDYALKHKIIGEKATSFGQFDVVIVALPPEATVEFIQNNKFKDGAVVTDICGVKKYIEDAVFSKPRNFRYVGCHPMAGKEVSGIQNACANLFDKAGMIITKNAQTDRDALQIVRMLTVDMGFARIIECSAETHDKKIAYTSQLAHIVSAAYVKDTELEGCIGFTGGSFQDMTRIAGVDENVWASLYLKNAENVSEKIGTLISSLSEIKNLIDGRDEQGLKAALREGRLRFDGNEKNRTPEDIFVQKLK